MDERQPVMTPEDMHAFMERVFPQARQDFTVREVRPMEVTVALNLRDDHLRPGGTISGPTMFALADVAIYMAVLGMIGPVALAVTTNCSIDFMRKPVGDKGLLAEARLLKLGKSLAVGDVLMHSEGDTRPVARATLTYAIPPEGSAAHVTM